MTQLYFVPQKEFDRVRRLEGSAVDRAAAVATLARINTLYAIKKAGSGHIGSSFSSLDIVSWLYLNELGEPDHQLKQMEHVYFSSKGHDVPGLYSVLTGLGMLDFELIHKLRRIDGLPGHPDVGTPFIPANTGSLGMGVSKAKGIVLADRLAGRKRRVFVMTGDGELQEGQFWESLLQAARRKMGEITVIVDHNKIQSDTWVENVSSLGDLQARFEAHGWKVARCDGHDLQALERILRQFDSVTDVPKAIIADTVKGKGVSFMESTSMPADQELYRFHSGAPSDEHYSRGAEELIARANQQLAALGADPLQLETADWQPVNVVSPKAEKLVAAYADALLKAGQTDPSVVVLDADLMLDCGLIPFRDQFPNRFIECGIAEQDMVSQAGALAANGCKPVVHSFACFLSSRPNEQFFNNATEHARVVYVGSLAGLVPGGPGHSHQCVRDIGSLRNVPGLTLIEPSCAAEVPLALQYALENTASTYLRLVSIPCDIPYSLPAGYQLTPGKGVALTDGSDAVMFGYGPVMLSQAVLAAQTLAKEGIGIKVVNLPWLNHVDVDWLEEAIGDAPLVMTIDNHFYEGGQGQFLLAMLAEHNLAEGRAKHCFAVRSIPACGTNNQVLAAHRLNASSLVSQIRELLQGRQASRSAA